MSNKVMKFKHHNTNVIVKVGDVGVSQLFVNGEPVDMSSKNENLRINVFTENLNATLENGDIINVKLKNPWATSVTKPNQFMQNSLGSNVMREVEAKINGMIMQPQEMERKNRDIDSMKKLYESYKQLGDLDKGQFLAMKAIAGHQIEPINNGLQTIDIALDRDGGFGNEQMVLTKLRPNSLSAGDVFRVQGGDPHIVNNVSIEKNPSALTFTPVHVTIECDDVTYTNYPYERDLKNFKKLAEKGVISVEDIKNLLPEHCTHDEFKIVQELHQKGIELSDPLLASLQQGMCVDDALKDAYNQVVEQEMDNFEEMVEELDGIDNPLLENEQECQEEVISEQDPTITPYPENENFEEEIEGPEEAPQIGG